MTTCQLTLHHEWQNAWLRLRKRGRTAVKLKETVSLGDEVQAKFAGENSSFPREKRKLNKRGHAGGVIREIKIG